MGLIVRNKTQTDRLTRSGAGFLGNYFDVISVQYELELDLRLDLRLRNPVFYDSTNDTLTLTSGSWVDLIGAFNGANVDIKFGTTGSPATSTTIVSVNGAIMTIAPASLGATGDKTAGYVEITDDPKDFEVSYNLVENTVSSGTGSLIDGEVVRFKGENVGALAVSGTIDLTQQGNKSGGSIFDTKLLTRVADATNGNLQYTLDLTYKIWTCLSSAQYFSSDAVGDFAEFTMLMQQSNPASAVTTSYFETGNTGFENENFNGGVPDYTLTSIEWTDNSANVMQVFDYTQDSNFEIVIEGAFTASDSIDVKMFTIPNDAGQYQNKPLPIENNLMLAQNPTPIAPSTPTNITGNLNELGAGFNIININSTIVGTTMTITGRVVPNNTFKTLFNSRVVGDRAYKLVIATEDVTEVDYTRSNRVNVLADSAQAQKNLIDLGSFGVSKLEFEDHNSDVYGATPNLYLEDDTLVTVEYVIPKILTTPALNPYVAIKGRIVIEQTTTGERYKLEEFVYDISGLPVLTDGSLPLDYLVDRGFKLPDTSDKKELIIERNTGADAPDVFGVRMKYPFITRYEDWITLQNVPVDFYSTDNNNWYNFASNPDWEIKFEHVIEENNPNVPFIQGEYIDEQVFTINDYDDWGETSTITFEKEDGTPLNKPSGVENTVVIATHTLAADTWSGNEYVEIHARPKKNAPQWTGSTVLDASDANNPLFPLFGETKTTIDVTAGTITSEVRFDFTKIDTTGGLTFTSRVKGDSLGGGERNNIVLLDTTVSRKPFVPGIGDITDPDVVAQMEECRGIKKCCPVEKKFASLTNDRRKYNCITAVYLVADSYTVTLKDENGNTTTYTPPVTTVFPSDPDALFVQIEWQDVALQDGFGIYTVEISQYFLNSVLQAPFVWGEYELKPYESDGVYNREGTARVLSKFNDVNDKLGIDFTGANIYDSLIIDGKFGYNEPNTEVNNTVYLDGRVEKVKREDFDTWELRVNLVTQYFIDRLRFHVLAENETWLSDNNATSPSYQLFDYPVIVNEGYVPEYFDGSRLQKGVVKYEDKVRICRTHFKNNRITAETLAPPSVNIPDSSPSIGARLLKTGVTKSVTTNDDGAQKEGRNTDWFTLDTSGDANPFGNYQRFTGTTGGYYDQNLAGYFDTSGVATTKALAFPDTIIIDWSQYDKNNSEVIGYRPVNLGLLVLIDGISACTSLSVGIYTSGWRMWNENEAHAVQYRPLVNDMFNWSPFEVSALSSFTNTPVNENLPLPNQMVVVQDSGIGWLAFNSASTRNTYGAVRTFTVTGTTIT